MDGEIAKADIKSANLKLLQGDSKDDMHLPIAGFNPMAGSHTLMKLKELIGLDVEKRMIEHLGTFQESFDDAYNLKVAINLIDDIGGSWSDRLITDYKNKFDNSGLLNRNFCVVPCWTSETFDMSIILKRATQCVIRAQFQFEYGIAKTLLEQIRQEQSAELSITGATPSEQTMAFIKENQKEDKEALLVSFWYGKEVIETLNYPNIDLEQKGIDLDLDKVMSSI